MLLFLLLYLFINSCETSLSCTGKTTFCIQNESCYLSCKQETNVTLVSGMENCSSPNVLYTNTTGNLLMINASAAGKKEYSCCKNKEWICSSTVIVSYEVKDVSCIWDLKNDTFLSCSVPGIPEDEISKKFLISMNINWWFGDRNHDEACDAISEFDFNCKLEYGYHDSDILIFINMVANNDATVNSERKFEIIPQDYVKNKELIIEVDKVTPESCTLNVTLPDDRNFYLENLCDPSCHITIEIRYTDLVTNDNFIESLNRTTNKRHVPSINMTNLRPNTLHIINSIRWKRIEDSIWSHNATLNFTTTVGVPKTSPLVLNKAKGNEYVGIYIQKRSEDLYYGPISLVLNKTTTSGSGQRSRRSLTNSQQLNFSQTVFVKYNETENETVTLQYATSAGISSENSEVFFSPQQNIQNVKRLIVNRYNRTHDSLTIDSVDGVDSLHFYWCYGEYLLEKQLVDCKSIGHTELKDVKETSYIQRPTSDANVNCTNCQLHYGVAIQQLNKTSSILWDSASEPIIDSILDPKDEHDVTLLYIIISISTLVGLVFVGCCILKGYRQFKNVPKPSTPILKSDIYATYYHDIDGPFTNESGSTSQSESNRTERNTSSSDSDHSDKPCTVIHTDTSNDYPTNIHVYPCNEETPM